MMPDCPGLKQPGSFLQGVINRIVTENTTNPGIRHVTLLFCIARYGLSYITFNYYSRWAQFSYRTAFLSAAVTYGIVVYKAFRARARAGSKAATGPLALASDENVQYLGS